VRVIQDVKPHEFYNLAAMSFVPAVRGISRC
jgi:GDP-D-mannose dehydratase